MTDEAKALHLLMARLAATEAQWASEKALHAEALEALRRESARRDEFLRERDEEKAAHERTSFALADADRACGEMRHERDEARATVRGLDCSWGYGARRCTAEAPCVVHQRDGARAEVERLRGHSASAYEVLREWDAYGTGGDVAACAREVTQQLREARAEVERLDAKWREALAMVEQALAQRDEARAEVERLRAGAEMFCRQQQHEAHAANVQLRAALVDAEDKLRSAHHVASEYVTAERTVAETNWRQLRDRLRESLTLVRAALAAKEASDE